jgi:oligopeptide transport system permease protein
VSRGAWLSGATLLALGIAALAGERLLPWSFDAVDWDHIATPPGAGAHWFGTDGAGRDLLARTLVGARVSLTVGIVATTVSVLVGVPWGAIAGYAGGRVDTFMMRCVDALYALPFLFLVILLVVVFGRHITLVFAALGLVSWLDIARITRGQVLALKERPFIELARAGGVPGRRILLRHLLPNVAGPVVVYATLTVPGVILAESFISFLGLGVQEPLTSFGALIAEGALEMEHAPWMLLFPAAFLAATLLAFNRLGDALRERLDPAAPAAGR